MMHAPLVSVLIPYYNDKKFLAESIASILKQNFSDFELLLLNHGSNDGSKEIAHAFVDPRIVHIDLYKNYGAGGGLLLKKFMQYTRGKYIKFFCADDIMLENCLNVLVNYFERHTSCDLAFADMEYVSETGSKTGSLWSSTRPFFCFDLNQFEIFKLLVRGINPLPYSTMMVKKSILEYAYIDNTVVLMFDMCLWASLILNGARVAVLNDVVVDYRQHFGQICTYRKVQSLNISAKFEIFIYAKIFLSIKELCHFQYICSEVGVDASVTPFDDIGISYAVSMFYMRHDNISYRYFAFEILHGMLQDDVVREKLIERFGFDVDKLRFLYRNIDLELLQRGGLKKYLRQTLAAKSALDLNFFEIFLIFVRRIWNKVKAVFNNSEKSKYTV